MSSIRLLERESGLSSTTLCKHPRCYLVIMQYVDGDRRDFVIISEGMAGKGWSCFTETLREISRKGW